MITEVAKKVADFTEGPIAHSSLGRRGWLLISVTTLLVCCFNLGGARSLTEHEVRIASGAKQMALDHDWLYPKLGDRLWLEKPPLLHWLIVGSAETLRKFSETTVRLPSVLAGAGVVVIITILALRWFGSAVAIFTGLIQATTVYFVTYARLAEPEMLLTLTVVLALFVFARLQSIGAGWRPPSQHLAMSFWVFVGLSNLAKGLGFGPFLILVPCAVFLILKRNRDAWRRMISWPGFVICLTIALAWPVTVALHVPEARQLWLVEISRRTTSGPNYDQPFWYYLTTIPWQLLPWIPALLVAALPSLKRAWHESDSPDRFIWCWAIVPITLLSFASGKHHHYIIACLCAVSPICAIGLLRAGVRFAAVAVALVVVGIVFVHARILPRYDRSRDDTEFLKGIRTSVADDLPLIATGGLDVAREMFYVDPPPQPISEFADLRNRMAGKSFYLIDRGRDEPALSTLGRVTEIAQSRHSRAEQSPSDRLTLFRIQPLETSAEQQNR